MITAALAIVVSPLTSSPAKADPGFKWWPDMGKHTWCFNTSGHKLGKAARKAARNSMAYLNNTTDATTAKKSTCKVSGSGQTDVVWRKDTTGASWIGRVDCRRFVGDPSHGDQCDRAWAILNVNLIANHYPNSATKRQRQRRKTACHELGHTVTLRHYSGSPPSPMTKHSCMRSGWAGSVDKPWIKRYVKHQRNSHINVWF